MSRPPCGRIFDFVVRTTIAPTLGEHVETLPFSPSWRLFLQDRRFCVTLAGGVSGRGIGAFLLRWRLRLALGGGGSVAWLVSRGGVREAEVLGRGGDVEFHPQQTFLGVRIVEIHALLRETPPRKTSRQHTDDCKKTSTQHTRGLPFFSVVVRCLAVPRLSGKNELLYQFFSTAFPGFFNCFASVRFQRSSFSSYEQQ